MKKFKKLLAILLVASMIFTTNAVNVFAEGMNANQEEQLNEETTVGGEQSSGLFSVYGALPEDEENSTEVKLGEPEEEPEEEAEETTVEAKLGEPEEEAEETTVGANACGAREEETETESELELELDKKKKDDQLYGEDPKNSMSYFIIMMKIIQLGH